MKNFFHIEFLRDGDDVIAPAGSFTIDVYTFTRSICIVAMLLLAAGEHFPASEFEPLYCLAYAVPMQHVLSEEKRVLDPNTRSVLVAMLLRISKGTTFTC